jgi:dTDP-4-dehydrorhamnose 3,5-epimerase
MLCSPTKIAGVFVLEQERKHDERGFFARTWCAEELSRNGVANVLSQASLSYNVRKGTLRGMHYQIAPGDEQKLVSVVHGAIYDVALDLRPESPTFCQWFACELTAKNGRMLYIPSGCAHGFQTLEDDTLVDYKISVPFAAELARGVRWNDPAFRIEWPDGDRVMSERDAAFADFRR